MRCRVRSKRAFCRSWCAMEKRIPDDKTWNVAPADTPHKIRFQPTLMSLALDETDH